MTLLDDLRTALGAEQVLIDGDLSAWEIDWRRRYRGRALAVVRPADTAQVAAVVRACARHGASLVPQGGNTGLVGGSVPDGSGTQVLLSLQRMNRVREVDVLLCASSMDPACRIEDTAEVERTYPRQARTPFNVTGHPALAMMAGLSVGGLKYRGIGLGAVGVSGVKSNEDAQIARAAIAALG